MKSKHICFLSEIIIVHYLFGCRVCSYCILIGNPKRIHLSVYRCFSKFSFSYYLDPWAVLQSSGNPPSPVPYKKQEDENLLRVNSNLIYLLFLSIVYAILE